MLQHSGPNGGACPSHGEALPQGRPAPLPRKYKTSLGLAQADFTSPEQGQCVGGGTQSPHPQGIISAGDDKAGLAGSRPNVGGGGPQLPQEDGRSPPPSERIIFSPCPSREGKGSIGAPAHDPFFMTRPFCQCGFLTAKHVGFLALNLLLTTCLFLNGEFTTYRRCFGQRLGVLSTELASTS